MKNIIQLFSLAFIFLLIPINSIAQEDKVAFSDSTFVKITMNDGTIHFGEFLYDDGREIGIEKKDLGKVIIPKHLIESIIEIDEYENSKDDGMLYCDFLPSRYNYTMSGYPLKKGKGYLKFMPYGVETQFPLTDNFSLGGLTTWFGAPSLIIAKYGKKRDEKFALSGGVIYGNSMYLSYGGNGDFESGIGLGFASFTFGEEHTNINVSAGYGIFHLSDEILPAGMISLAGVYRLSNQAQLVFDSAIFTNVDEGMYWVNPGVRYAPRTDWIFQFGLHIMGDLTGENVLLAPGLNFTKVFGK